ncbi:hypothetical protein GW750_06425 [bacterium]|nr:hypothetical protein [bacterium]
MPEKDILLFGKILKIFDKTCSVSSCVDSCQKSCEVANNLLPQEVRVIIRSDVEHSTCNRNFSHVSNVTKTLKPSFVLVIVLAYGNRGSHTNFNTDHVLFIFLWS